MNSNLNRHALHLHSPHPGLHAAGPVGANDSHVDRLHIEAHTPRLAARDRRQPLEADERAQRTPSLPSVGTRDEAQRCEVGRLQRRREVPHRDGVRHSRHGLVPLFAHKERRRGRGRQRRVAHNDSARGCPRDDEVAVAESEAEGVDGLTRVEAVRAPGVAVRGVGPHPHVEHGHLVDVLGRVDGERQTTGRRDVAEQKAHDGGAAELSGIAHPQKGVGLHGADVHRAARHDQDGDVRRRRGTSGDVADECALDLGDRDVRQVDSLRRHRLVAANHKDHRVHVTTGRRRTRLRKAAGVGARHVAAAGVAHVALSDSGLQRRPRGRQVRRGTGVVALHHDTRIRVGANDRHRAHRVRLVRQTVLLVLHQHDALLGNLECERRVLVGVDDVGGEALVGLVLDGIEDAETELHSEHMTQRRVNVGHLHRTVGECLRGVRLQERAAVEVHTGLERRRARCVRRVGVVVLLEHVVHGLAVAHNIPLEAPRVARERRQEVWVRAAGFAVDGVVAAHDAGRRATVLMRAGLETRRVRVGEVLRGHNGVERVAVLAAPVLQGVGREVLATGRRLETRRVLLAVLEVVDKVRGVDRGQVRVLAGRLLTAAPARVAVDVHVRGPERETGVVQVAQDTRGAADGTADAGEDVGVEGGACERDLGVRRGVADGHVVSSVDAVGRILSPRIRWQPHAHRSVR
eukprot:PhM_4_TR16096/c0_g1_i2/m.90073